MEGEEDDAPVFNKKDKEELKGNDVVPPNTPPKINEVVDLTNSQQMTATHAGGKPPTDQSNSIDIFIEEE